MCGLSPHFCEVLPENLSRQLIGRELSENQESEVETGVGVPVKITN